LALCILRKKKFVQSPKTSRKKADGWQHKW
jgi:hypothetical protein